MLALELGKGGGLPRRAWRERAQTCLETVIYSAAATLPAIAFGLLLGYPLASSLASASLLAVGPFAVYPWILLLGLAVGFGVPLLSARVPLWIGTRITVREALSAYGISAGRAGQRRARLSQRLTGVSQTTWLGLRGVFRKRARAALTLLTLTPGGNHLRRTLSTLPRKGVGRSPGRRPRRTGAGGRSASGHGELRPPE